MGLQQKRGIIHGDIMLTNDNTTGFTDEQLDEMNRKVANLMINYEDVYGDYDAYLQWAEEKVLKEYGGA